jgi:hypothetical protein
VWDEQILLDQLLNRFEPMIGQGSDNDSGRDKAEGTARGGEGVRGEGRECEGRGGSASGSASGKGQETN